MAEKDRYFEKLCSSAEAYYRLRSSGASQSVLQNSWAHVAEALNRYMPLLHRFYGAPNGLEQEETWNVAIDLLFSQFPDDREKGWKPEMGPFAACFLNLLKKKIISAAEKKNKEQSGFQDVSDGEGHAENPGAELEARDIFSRFFRLLSEEIMFQIKATGAKRFCYIRCFYTEWLARNLMQHDAMLPDILRLMPPHEQTRADLEFAGSFLDGPVASLAEIRERHLRMLSDFTGAAKHAETPCGFALKKAVYIQYISRKRNRAVSDSVISNHRRAFDELVALQYGRAADC